VASRCTDIALRAGCDCRPQLTGKHAELGHSRIGFRAHLPWLSNQPAGEHFEPGRPRGVGHPARFAPGESGATQGLNGDESDNGAPQSGADYIFSRATSHWTQHVYLKAANAEASDFFGEVLALSTDGSTLAIGAPGERSSATAIN
jgi:FG-GAP repeat